jgi:hypothetical protein
VSIPIVRPAIVGLGHPPALLAYFPVEVVEHTQLIAVQICDVARGITLKTLDHERAELVHGVVVFFPTSTR